MPEIAAASATLTPPGADPLGARSLPKHSLIVRIAQRYSVDPDKLLSTLKATAFKQPIDRDTGIAPEVSNEQMMALLVVADQYRLNPFTRELYAFADSKRGGIVPIVSVDGWARIINEHPQFDGVEFAYGFATQSGMLEWIEAIIYRKDRSHPTKVRELMAECKRNTDPWKSHPSRMLRHKSLIQCARLAFGFAGIYDQDEAERIIAGEATRIEPDADMVRRINEELKPAARSAAAAPIENHAATATSESPSAAPQAEAPAETIAGPAATEAPSAAFVRSLIEKAQTEDECDEARDLIEWVADEAKRAELDVEERAKRKAIRARAGNA